MWWCTSIDDILVANTSDKEHLEMLQVEYLPSYWSRDWKWSNPNVPLCWNTREDTSCVRSTKTCKRSSVEILPGPCQLLWTYSSVGVLWLHSISLWKSKNNGFWKQAFKETKSQLIFTKILTHFEPSKELVLSCDASPYGWGLCCPIGFQMVQRDQLHMPPSPWQ